MAEITNDKATIESCRTYDELMVILQEHKEITCLGKQMESVTKILVSLKDLYNRGVLEGAKNG